MGGRKADRSIRTSAQKKYRAILWLLCGLILLVSQAASAQKKANVTGSWTAVTKMSDRNITEQWSIQQSGEMVTGTIKSEQGELPFMGTIDDAGFMRVDFKAGEIVYKVRATLDNDSMDGSITIGKKEYIWTAKKSGAQ